MGYVRLIMTAVILASAVAATNPPAAAQTEQVLYTFENDGAHPQDSLIVDASGNLYGTTQSGGAHGGGTAFELTARTGGGYNITVLHSFGGAGDGYGPYAGLVSDAAGNLYGTTIDGGNAYGNNGVVFELIRADGWQEKVLHNFTSGPLDGANPWARLIFDTAGNLYGTTADGGTNGRGTAFELTPNRAGGWGEKILHSFDASETDGYEPLAGLIFDRFGKLYGTTFLGGSTNYGTAFRLTPGPGGHWTETILHSFQNDGVDGHFVYGALIFDRFGNLYGASNAGGAGNVGTVFELSPTAGAVWNETILHDFSILTTDGNNSYASLILDESGNLYGTTAGGGVYNGGTAFELTPVAGGGWNETILHSFNGTPGDGADPEAALVFDTVGNLFGTTVNGGDGTIFEIRP